LFENRGKAMLLRFVAGALLIAAIIPLAGCRPAPASKIGRFRADQEGTVTPHGRIKMDTVDETADGRISYETSDGASFVVDARENADGTLRYGQPTRGRTMQ
jgi:hypothetical protein